MIPAILNRRSTRSFLDCPLNDPEITALLEAAASAPSSGNRQPWHFTVVKNKEVIRRLATESLRQPFVGKAPLLIAVSIDHTLAACGYGERGEQLYAVQDTAAAIQNMLLTAEDLGFGSCWCGAFDEEKAKELMGLTDQFRPVALIPFGHIKSPSKKRERRPLSDIVLYIE